MINKKLIIEDLKNKKGIRELNNKYFENLLELELKENPELKEKLKNKNFKQIKKSQIYKEFLKKTRKELRTKYGMFLEDNYNKKNKFLKKYKETKNKEFLNEILKLHKSTNERFDFYEDFYEEIFNQLELENNTIKILDLGCGLNPISSFLIKEITKKEIEYFCTDLSKEDMNFLQEYFQIENIKAKTFDLDLTKDYEKLKNYNADICFAFKLFDSLERKERNITKKIIKNLNCKYLIASFPTKSLGGKKNIEISKRKWFEKLFLEQKTITFKNEKVYLLLVSSYKNL